MSHLSPDAQRAVDEARAVMASKRASCCRHGVNRDRCADCQRSDEHLFRKNAGQSPEFGDRPEKESSDA